MKAINLVLLFTILFCCAGRNKNSLQLQGKNSYPENQSAEFIKYEFENSSYRQKVLIKNLSDTVISFNITTESKIGNRNSIIQGLAKRKISDALPQDVNEKEEAYGVYQYIYTNDSCKLLIRIAAETKDLLKLFSFNCYLLGEKDGLFTLGVLLKRID